MNWTAWAIANRTAVFVFVVLVTVAGAYTYLTLPREAAPEIEVPYVLVVTTNRGASPEDIEWNITDKIEQQIKGLSGLKEFRSTSAEGASMVVLEFYPEVVIEDALQKVRERVDLAQGDRNWPADADEPLVKEINLSEIPVIYLNLSGDLEPAALKEFGEDLAERLEGLEGVLSVQVTGGREREVGVEVDPYRLQGYRVPLPALLRLVDQENATWPAGSLELDPLTVQVRVPGEYQDPAEVGALGLAAGPGRVVRVRDLAEVRLDSLAREETRSRLDGRDSVTLAIQKRSGANIIKVVRLVREALARERARFPAGVAECAYTFDMSQQIQLMVEDLENSVFTASLFVLAVVWAAMGGRNSLFVAIAIPLSLLLTFLVLAGQGATLNMVVLFSLVMASGMLVDNAVVIVENAYRHHSLGKDPARAAVEATREVLWPVVTSTLTTVAAFLPLLYWPDTIGKFLAFLPRTIIIALLASLFVALVINPVLCATWMKLKPGRALAATAAGTPLNWATVRYRRLLGWCADRPGRVLAGTVLAFFLLLFAFGARGRGVTFLPTTDPQQAFVDIRAAEGTALEETDRLARAVEARLLEYLPGRGPRGGEARHVIADVGSAGTGEISLGGGGQAAYRARVAVDFPDFEDRPRSSLLACAEIRETATRGLSGAEFEVREAAHGPPKEEYPVNIEISGPDFVKLAALARLVQDALQGVPGLLELQDDLVTGRPELRPLPDRDRMAISGVGSAGLADHVKCAVEGVKVGVWRFGEEEYDIRVRLPAELRDRVDTLAALAVSDGEGDPVPLSGVADLAYVPGYGAIKRKDGQRTVTVHGRVDEARGFTAMGVLQEAARRLAGAGAAGGAAGGLAAALPADYRVSIKGEQEEIEKAQAFLGQAFFIGVGLIALILILEFNSVLRSLIVLATVFLSLIGVFLHLVIAGAPFVVIMTGMGVISLAGVVVNNGIILIDYIGKLQERGLPLREAVLEAGMTRLRPVLLTAVSTILGLTPVIFNFSISVHSFPPRLDFGTESAMWWGPMAWAVAAGMAVATGLTLIVVPCLYLLVERLRQGLLGAAAARAPRRESER